MVFARLLALLFPLLVSACASDGGAAPDGGTSPGSGGMGTGGGSTTDVTGGASAVGGTSAAGGSEGSGGAPTTIEQDCELVDDPELLPQVTLPPDECAGQPEVTPPESPGGCLLWTGSGYLAAFSDARGVVVAALSADGDTLSETILSTEPTDYRPIRLSKNGDEVLVVLDLGPTDVATVAILDLQGSPLTELNLLAGENYPQRFNFAATASGDGWLVAFGYNSPSTGARGVLVSEVSKTAHVSKQLDIEVHGYTHLNGFASGEDGTVLLEGTYDTGGQGGNGYEATFFLDRDLEAASCVAVQVY